MNFKRALSNLKASTGVRYGWWVVVAGVVILTLAGDTLTDAFTVILFSTPLEDWRTARALAILSAIPGSAILLPIAGLAVDRFGPRRMALTGVMLCGTACVTAAAWPNGWAAPALNPVLWTGVLIGTNAPVMAAINQWFHDKRTLAIAVTLFAESALELLLAKRTALPAVSETVLVLGALALVLGLPAAAMLRKPSRAPNRSDDPSEAEEHGNSRWDDGRQTVEYWWKEAVRTREFWLLAAGGCGVAAAGQLIRTLGFQLADYRFHMEGSYGTLADVHEIVSAAFILIGAATSMRIGLRAALWRFAALQLVALAVILLANGPGWVFAGIMILGAGYGGGIALEISAIGEYFGRRRFATLMGTGDLVTRTVQGVVLGLLFSLRPLLAYLDWDLGLPSDPSWWLATAAVPATVGVAAYWKLGDPKPAPSQLATTADG